MPYSITEVEMVWMTTQMRNEFDEYIKKFKASKPEEIQQKMQDAITELEESEEGNGLKKGDKAPNFTLPDAEGKSVEL